MAGRLYPLDSSTPSRFYQCTREDCIRPRGRLKHTIMKFFSKKQPWGLLSLVHYRYRSPGIRVNTGIFSPLSIRFFGTRRHGYFEYHLYCNGGDFFSLSVLIWDAIGLTNVAIRAEFMDDSFLDWGVKLLLTIFECCVLFFVLLKLRFIFQLGLANVVRIFFFCIINVRII